MWSAQVTDASLLACEKAGTLVNTHVCKSPYMALLTLYVFAELILLYSDTAGWSMLTDLQVIAIDQNISIAEHCFIKHTNVMLWTKTVYLHTIIGLAPRATVIVYNRANLHFPIQLCPHKFIAPVSYGFLCFCNIVKIKIIVSRICCHFCCVLWERTTFIYHYNNYGAYWTWSRRELLSSMLYS